MNKLKAGIYCHYKGGLYKLLRIAKDSETLEDIVVYQALYGEGEFWVRTAKMWSETIDVNGIQVPRFEFCGKNSKELKLWLEDASIRKKTTSSQNEQTEAGTKERIGAIYNNRSFELADTIIEHADKAEESIIECARLISECDIHMGAALMCAVQLEDEIDNEGYCEAVLNCRQLIYDIDKSLCALQNKWFRKLSRICQSMAEYEDNYQIELEAISTNNSDDNENN